MAHARNQSMGDSLKSPHTVSLKVLRLSRPTLATQHPLPDASELGISRAASLAYPAATPATPTSILSPVLTLPEAFGSAYVGETFSCTLCANNELAGTDNARAVSGVKMVAEMQTPSNPQGATLELVGREASEDAKSDGDPGPGQSMQRVLRFELKEEGNHVLAVTVTYTETAIGEGRASGGRVRTFRKLYQFVAQQLLSVRTKVGEPSRSQGRDRYLLEAQLENMGEAAVCLEAVTLNPRSPLTSTSLNWDLQVPGSGEAKAPILTPRDVIQVAFLLEHDISTSNSNSSSAAGAEGSLDNEATATTAASTTADGKKVLGQLVIQWRSALGDQGSLSTGWLTSRQ